MSQITSFNDAGGTVTSISQGTGITLTPNPIVGAGTVALTIPVAVANGGTNATSMATTYGVNYFDGTRLVTTAVGNAGEVLTSNGVGVAPTFQAAGGASFVGFSAFVGATQDNVTGDGTNYTVIYGTELYDIGSAYNNATGVFTAPSNGQYYFNTTLLFSDAGAATVILIRIITTSRTFEQNYQSTANAFSGSLMTCYADAAINMTAGDTCFVQIQGNGGGLDVNVFGDATTVYSYFSGQKIG